MVGRDEFSRVSMGESCPGTPGFIMLVINDKMYGRLAK